MKRIASDESVWQRTSERYSECRECATELAKRVNQRSL